MTSHTDSLAPRTAEGDGGSVLSGQSEQGKEWQGLVGASCRGSEPTLGPLPLPEMISPLPNQYAVGEPGRGLSRRQVWLLELSYGLGKPERQRSLGGGEQEYRGRKKKKR